jgi:hypothetical protein
MSLWFGIVSATAQTADPREQGRSRLGPFHISPAFTLEELGLDTNVFNDESEQSDFTFTAVPKVDIAVPFGRWAQIRSSTAADFIYFHQYESERSINPDVRLRGEVTVHRITLFVAPSYTNSRRRPSLEIDARARHQTRDLSGGADIRLSEKMALQLGIGTTEVSFDENAVFEDTVLRATLNRTGRTGWLSVRRDVTPLTTVVVRAQVNEERFPFSPERNADSLRLVPSVEFKPRALLNGGASVGIRHFQPKNGLLPDYTGVVAQANLSYTLQGSTRFRFTANRDLAYSYSSTQPYYAINAYGLAINRHIGGRFDVTAGGDWQTYTYRSLVGLEPQPIEPSVNRTRTWTLSTGYRFRETRRLGFGVTYRERDSNDTQFQPYSGLRIMWTMDSGL